LSICLWVVLILEPTKLLKTFMSLSYFFLDLSVRMYLLSVPLYWIFVLLYLLFPVQQVLTCTTGWDGHILSKYVKRLWCFWFWFEGLNVCNASKAFFSIIICTEEKNYLLLHEREHLLPPMQGLGGSNFSYQCLS